MSDTQTRRARIESVLQGALSPSLLEIRDDSARHAHHAGARALARGPSGAGETHFDIVIVSARFDGLSRIDRHRLVNGLLKDEFAGGLHALSLVLRGEKESAV